MALSPVAGSWARWRLEPGRVHHVEHAGAPCLLLVVAGPLPPGTFSIGRRRRNARKADDQAAALAEPGTGRSFGGRLQPWGPPARNRPRRAPNGPSAAIQAHQEESHGPASSLPRLSRPGTASAVRGGPVDRREHLPAYSPAHALRELDELVRQIGASLDDRASASERAQGLLRRMSEQGFCEDDDFPCNRARPCSRWCCSGARDSRCRWRWWPWNWRGGWTFRWSE